MPSTPSASAGTTAYTYDDADRITEVQPPSPASAIAYDWDDNGNLVERGSDAFEWDYEDRMVEATVNSVTSTFAYRGDGLRDSRTVGMTTTTFTWDINAGLPVVLDDGNQYLYGAGLSAMKQGSDWFYYLADGLGSTMAIVDASGDVENGYTYDVYGEPTVTGSLANEFDFAGQQTDGSTGLQYLRARYYDPATGTFLSRDPLAQLPSWLGSPFGYAYADPIGLNDPSGLDSPVDNLRRRLHPCNLGVIGREACEQADRVKEAWEGVGNAVNNAIEGATGPVGMVQDIVAFAVVVGSMSLLGEYAHYRIKACALSVECRSILDNLNQFRTLNAAELALAARGFRGASVLLSVASGVWQAYKRAFDSSQQTWTTLRGKLEYQERVRIESEFWSGTWD